MWIVTIMSTYSVSGWKEQKIAGEKDYFGDSYARVFSGWSILGVGVHEAVRCELEKQPEFILQVADE